MTNTASPTLAREGGGFTATCPCLWLRWWPDEKAAQQGLREHEKKCKTCAGGDS